MRCYTTTMLNKLLAKKDKKTLNNLIGILVDKYGLTGEYVKASRSYSKRDLLSALRRYLEDKGERYETAKTTLVAKHLVGVLDFFAESK